MIGMLNKADSAQAVITKARALHPAAHINVCQLTSDYISNFAINRERISRLVESNVHSVVLKAPRGIFILNSFSDINIFVAENRRGR